MTTTTTHVPKTLEELLHAAAVLTGPSSSSEIRPADLKGVLHRRLSEYHALYDQHIPAENASLESLQLETATESLLILELLHKALTSPATPAPADHEPGGPTTQRDPSMIGTRDMGLIRTLLSIVFKWAVEPLLQRIVAGIPSTSTSHAVNGARIIDLTGLPHEFSTLSSVTSRLLSLPLSDGITSPLSQSAVTATLLNRHLPDLLLPCIVIGWLPKSLATETMPTADSLRPQVMYLLSRLPASQVISAVGQTLSRAPGPLPYARKTCTFILGRQLIRPEGIRGLCESVFAEEDVSGEDASLEKLEHVARVLCTVPSGMKAEEYCAIVIPRMLLLVSVEDRALPPAHRRAIAFSLSRILTSDANPPLQKCSSDIALAMLHDPILQGNGELTVSASLRTIEVLLTNTDPSPTFISTLFTPIVPSLYALYAHLEGAKTADPLLRESLKGFLETWGRLVGSTEVLGTLWRIIDGEGGIWRVDVAGSISRTEEDDQNAESLSLFTPESLRHAEEAGELDVDSNILGLKPDPVQFVRFVKGLGRADVSSELFVRLLQGYRELQSQRGNEPLKTLLYLQLVLQMQMQISDDDASNVLKKPEHILSFVKHALENPRQPEGGGVKRSSSDAGLRMEDLRIVEDEPDEVDEVDSDDEEPDAGNEETVDDMTTTAVKLLLAVLEANPDLSARTAPVLNDIFSLLEPFSRVSNEELRSLVREARMVMTARLASTSDTSTSKSSKSAGETESPQETYQKALKLLQDPLLPVRAHGLMLLRQLVSARKSTTGTLSEPALDRALVPGILSIFMQSIQDDDSYMFLNAVQGLSAMVDGFGKDVLRGLVKTYSDGVDGLGASAMSQHDVDMRTRVGEALGQVIRRCGDALPSYASLLVPPLFQVVRTSHFPTVLRTSAISLLAQSVRTNALAVLPYIVDLTEAMIDLLQVETVPAPQRTGSEGAPEAKSEAGEAAETETDRPKPHPTMDSQPTSTNTKFPPLRRAALHFLALLIQACTKRIYETGDTERFLLPPDVMRRAKTTLWYIVATDADDVVRVMARETAEGLDQLANAALGL
ncbi:hypothetical protein L226DRAFT_608532, partial [Lentinus tigrinus ALCF2SS1-7]|uniref:RNA polymerase II assembly factor Rtp1 C-terminal domain-containing protein n=1 Tax=Lentinus tigrinus ALCF2SS1-6 TaxID=1328759 RepID=A0A5C2SUL7_9APHY